MREDRPALTERVAADCAIWRAAIRAWLVIVVVLSGYGVGRAQPAPGPAILAPEEAKVLVSRFRVTGSTVFLPEELQALLADGEGKALTLTEIEALAGRITAHYRRRGYILARAYVPAQEIREGIVEIAVLEGRIGEIRVEGAKWYSPDYLRSYLAPVEAAPVFKEDRHERGLLLLNDLPGLAVKSVLKPGAELGTTDIVLNVEKDRLITGSLDANNYGSRFTGRERFGLSLNLNNPLGVGDALSFRGVVSIKGDDLWVIRSSYIAPLSSWGTKVGAAYTHVEAQVGEQLRELDIFGAGDVASVFATHPFFRSQAFSLYGQAGFDHKNFETTVLGERANRDRLRVLTFGGSLDAIDGWRGVTNVTATAHQGIPGFMGGLRLDDDPNASRQGASGRFTKLTMEALRLQQLVGPTSLFLKAGGQWASSPLVSPEQFTVGGMGTVRGYPLAEIAGDHGYTLGAEFRWNAPGFSEMPAFRGKRWGEILQFFTFVDHGSATVIDPIPGQARKRELTGGGIGLRFGIPDLFHLKVEFAKPVPKPDPSDGLDNVIYFQYVGWF
jgi:hemolysin activation/secretion protein